MTPKAPPRGLMLEPRELQKTQQKPMVFDGFSRIQPLPFIFCSMLIKHGLKMSSRSHQERSKMPQDAQRPPTWGQHGPNMGSKKAPRSVQGGVKLLSRRGHQLRLLSDRSHGPHMDPKYTPNAPQVGVMLGSSWGRLGVIWGSS